MNNCLTSDERLVIYALSIGALKLDQNSGIELKSGRMSPFFFNSGLFNTGESMLQLIKAYNSAVPNDIKFDGIFGPAYKGITLSAGLAMQMGTNVKFFFDRKEEKDHGEKGQIVGGDVDGLKLLLIDDVMTSGKSVIDAHKLVEKSGATVKAVTIAFDRQEVASDGSMSMSAVQRYEEEYGIEVFSAANLQTLINLFDRVEELANPILQRAILKYKSTYGV
ncbi:orotate phosphoribosyltransferase [bacterium]|jgi:orotate phosphoribosyltransferase|nr:orotate phosphoribosyltransferase [bacterium]MBT3853117.1 orotate phosphoribosyltransferase [bacterium]MBT5492790.1 orotate phosphoribosyltransferase [bacterium]MBT6778524.1 orotate phosphoribosyltransferase [bacterium]